MFMKKISLSCSLGGIVGCGLVAAGIVAQLIFGEVDWGAVAWPVNVVILAAFVVVVVLMYVFRGRVGAIRWLGSLQSAVWSLAFAVAVSVALGLLRQSNATDAAWHERLLSSWPFAMVYGWLALSLGMAIMRVGSRRWTWRTVAFMLNHVGLLVVLVAATLGSADMQRARMMVGLSSLGYEPQKFAYAVNGDDRDVVKMDFSIGLKDLIIEEQPQQKYASRVDVYGADGRICISDAIVEVNRPLSIGGWKIYQVSYDSREQRYSVFELVRDPWIGAVYAGIFMMLAGALALLLIPKQLNMQA